MLQQIEDLVTVDSFLSGEARERVLDALNLYENAIRAGAFASSPAEDLSVDSGLAPSEGSLGTRLVTAGG